MDKTGACVFCGAPMNWVAVKEAVPGSRGGFSPVAATYDWDHHAPNDCLKTINGKLDVLLRRIGEPTCAR